MITKEFKRKLLERYKNNDEKILVASVLDKVNRFEKTSKIENTCFLNLNEFSIITSILNELNIKYIQFSLNDILNKKMIFFIPEYIECNNEFFSSYISCLKIKTKASSKLTHKDYMGSIFSLGVKHEVIGDIFALKESGYVFCEKSISDYILYNLYKVGNQEVEVTNISLDSNELQRLSLNLEEKDYIVASKRIDVVLAAVYNLSRSEVKGKVQKGDLFLNDKNEYYLSHSLKEGDIVSFRKCGKFKVGKEIRKTRSDRIVIKIYKYS